MKFLMFFHSFFAKFWFLNNFLNRHAILLIFAFPWILGGIWFLCPFPDPIPFLVSKKFGPKKSHFWKKILFILEKWFQVRGVRTPIPQMSGEALVDAPKWWKNIILFLYVIGLVIEKNPKNKKWRPKNFSLMMNYWRSKTLSHWEAVQYGRGPFPLWNNNRVSYGHRGTFFKKIEKRTKKSAFSVSFFQKGLIFQI